MARRNGRPDIAHRFEADGCWPWNFTVRERFGTWNAAIAAAGFEPRRPGGREYGAGNIAPLAVPLALEEPA